MGLAFSPEGSSHVRYHVRSDVRSGQLAGTLKRPVHRGFRRLMLGMLGLLRKTFFCNSLSFQNYSLSLHYRLLVLRGKAGGLIL